MSCPYGKQCIFAHNKLESRLHGWSDMARARVLQFTVAAITYVATRWKRKQRCILLEGEDDIVCDESNIGEDEYDMNAINWALYDEILSQCCFEEEES